MAIYDNNGTTDYEIGKLYDNDGTTDYQIGKVYDNDGTTDSLIYSAEESMICSGWSLSKPTTARVSSYTANISTIELKMCGNTSVGWTQTFFTSPQFDITGLTTLTITGSSYKRYASPMSDYCPRIYLVNSSGTKTQLWIHPAVETHYSTQSVSVSKDVSSLSGKYTLQIMCPVYHYHSDNEILASMTLTKALLTA